MPILNKSSGSRLRWRSAIRFAMVAALFQAQTIFGFSTLDPIGTILSRRNQLREGTNTERISIIGSKRLFEHGNYDVTDESSEGHIHSNLGLNRRQALSALVASAATLAVTPSIAAAAADENSPTFISGMGTTISLTKTVEPKLSLSEPSSLQESLSGFVAGASLSITKTLVKFPLDTATVRVQMPNSVYSIRDPKSLLDGCFNGISLTLLSNIPAGAVFFGVKDAVKSAIRNSDDFSTMPRWMSTSVSVAAGMIPYWLVRNPSEVIKVRQQANIEGYGDGVSAIEALQQTFRGDGHEDDNNLSEFYTGYWENILYAYPADVIKFVAYESITQGRKDLSPIEGAKAGALATALAQLVTTPLDVVRNRLMTGKNKDGLPLSDTEKNRGYIDSLVTLGKEEGLSGLFAGSTPRASKAILSGAIQFATYEETKQTISKMLRFPS